jgi:hypothetical protein
MWRGQIMWADLSRSDMAALVAFFEARDGRVTPFEVTLAAGFASQFDGGFAQVVGTTPAAPALGVDRVKLTTTPNLALRAGTLLGFGATNNSYQMCEVVRTGFADGLSDVYIAPRIRRVPSNLFVTMGTVPFVCTLADDELKSVSWNPAYGTLTVDVIEAL